MKALSPEHVAARDEFRAFAGEHVRPIADELHRTENTPPGLVRLLGDRGYLGLSIPSEHAGGGRDMVTLGLLAGELGKACSSVRSLVTVHSMVAHAVRRWGSRDQRSTWLPRLASGERVGAFALSEPSVGSDAASVTARLIADGDDFVLDGKKVWVTYGRRADLFLVVARGEAGPTAVLVDRETPNVQIEPIPGLSGLRASMIASVRFDRCRVPRANLIGRQGLGISHVASSALDLGRYTVAWGSVGILEACLEASVAYASQREQFGVRLKEHQLVRQMVTNMATDLRAARLLCLDAGRLRDARDPDALAATSIAKYFASTAAVRAASDAVQIHGANGCSADYPLQRYLGDAKIMEIIEGSTQIQQLTIADYAYQDYADAEVRGGEAQWRRQ